MVEESVNAGNSDMSHRNRESYGEKVALAVDFESAVRLLVERMPVSTSESRKPILFHDIRVGTYLYESGYSRDVVLAGVLHDALEWSGVNEEMLRKGFGDYVANVVKACSKDKTITDGRERIIEMVSRCAIIGHDALVVKAADTLDSFKWYDTTGNEKELLYCVRVADAMFQVKLGGLDGNVFSELRAWYDKYTGLLR